MRTNVVLIATLIAATSACKKSNPAKADLKKLAERWNTKLEALRGIDQSLMEVGQEIARKQADPAAAQDREVTVQDFERMQQLAMFCKDLPDTLAFLRVSAKEVSSGDVRKRLESLQNDISELDLTRRSCGQPQELECMRSCMTWYELVIGELYMFHLEAKMQDVDLILVRRPTYQEDDVKAGSDVRR
jgi:hypothetical protein